MSRAGMGWRTCERRFRDLQRIDGIRGRGIGCRILRPRAKVETDDDGIEDDAEFEDKEGGDLLPEAALEFGWVGVFGPVVW